MPWLQIILDTEAPHVESISEALMAVGALSVTWQDAQDQPLYEPQVNTTPLWSRTRIVGLFEQDTEPTLITTQLAAILATLPPYHFQTLEDQDWAQVCMKDFQARCFGDYLWICPSWQTPPDSQAINICLDPGLAFGTGTHPTTALCLEWLAHQRDFTGKTLIDYGCGSGILAIAAAKLGATQVWAVDNDPQALSATIANAQKNFQTTKIFCTSPEDLPPLQADGLLANILAKPLIELLPTFTNHLKKNASLVLSGILQEQLEEVIAAYHPYFTITQVVTQTEWVRIVAEKKNF